LFPWQYPLFHPLFLQVARLQLAGEQLIIADNEPEKKITETTKFGGENCVSFLRIQPCSKETECATFG